MDMANRADMRALIAGLQDQMRLALSSEVRFPVDVSSSLFGHPWCLAWEAAALAAR